MKEPCNSPTNRLKRYLAWGFNILPCGAVINPYAGGAEVDKIELDSVDFHTVMEQHPTLSIT